jgi:acyl carrier protein
LWEETRIFSGEEQARLAQFGLEPMPVDQAMATLARLLEGDAVQKVVAAVDWAVLKPAYEAKRPRPFLSQVESFAPPAIGDRPRAAANLTLAQQLGAWPPDERNEFLLGYVGRQVAYVMGHDDGQPLEVERGLFEMGMDSLMAVELKNRLETAVGRRLPAGLTFNYPNIKALAAFLAQELVGETKAVEPAAAPPPSLPVHEVVVTADLESVSEQELLALFDDELAAIEGLDL